MDRTAFLERLFTMFPLNFNENNIPYWSEAYESVLIGSINYDKLFKFMITEHNNMSAAPSPKWFSDNRTNYIVKDDLSPALRHMEEIKQDSVPMPESFKLRMEELKKKMSMGA